MRKPSIVLLAILAAGCRDQSLRLETDVLLSGHSALRSIRAAKAPVGTRASPGADVLKSEPVLRQARARGAGSRRQVKLLLEALATGEPGAKPEPGPDPTVHQATIDAFASSLAPLPLASGDHLNHDLEARERLGSALRGALSRAMGSSEPGEER